MSGYVKNAVRLKRALELMKSAKWCFENDANPNAVFESGQAYEAVLEGMHSCDARHRICGLIMSMDTGAAIRELSGLIERSEAMA